MNEHEARQLMIAADDDPMLAAWAAVSFEHGVVCVSDTSPYEAWEAFQGLYNHDLISSDDYNQGEHLFFNKIPRTEDIQDVLSRIDPHQYSKEPTMSNNNFNPFATDNSIARRTEPKGNSQIQSRSSKALDNPFASSAPAPAIARRPPEGEISGDFFDQHMNGGLPCHDPTPNNNISTSIDGQLYTPDVRCCRIPVSMTEVERVGSDGGNNIGSQLTLAVFEGVCHECGFIHHNSVGRMADPGAFR
jgi:hypothetical protein